MVYTGNFTNFSSGISMDNKNSKALKYIDGAIVVFIFIYLASLTSSIFVNQIGYFIPLMLLCVRYYITRENVFRKTGLETAIVIMIGAEIIATIFSVNAGQSFNNFLKFFLLIPTLYLFSADIFSFNQLKLFFKVYMGFALASCLIYLVLSYEYFIYNQFQIQQSGPSPFKYPITASELLSFTVIFFFSFLVNEKTDRKNKILYLLGFIISLLALLVIYKRTGWFGTAAGIFFVLVYARKWKVVIPILIAGAAIVLYEKGISELTVGRISGNQIVKISSGPAAGRAYDLLSDSGKVYLSSYDEGLYEINPEGGKTKQFNAPSALTSFSKWKEKYYVGYLNDTRFVLYEKEQSGKFTEKGRFISPGFTTSYKTANGMLYACDSDSGLTIFKNPGNLADTVNYSYIKGNTKILADSSFLAAYSLNENELTVYRLSGGLVSSPGLKYKTEERFDPVEIRNGMVIISGKSGLSVLKIIHGGIEKKETYENLKGVYVSAPAGDTTYFASYSGKIYKALIDSSGIKTLVEFNIDFVPGKFALSGDRIYLTRLKESRFASTFDKYNLSNMTRLALWGAGIKIFSDHPVTGVGNIDLADLYRKYKNEYDKEIQGHMHNNFVHILVTLGVIGFAAFIFLLVKMFLLLHKLNKESKEVPFVSSYALGTMGGMTAFVVAGLTEWNFGDHEIITMVWFTLALSIGLLRKYRELQKN